MYEQTCRDQVHFPSDQDLYQNRQRTAQVFRKTVILCFHKKKNRLCLKNNRKRSYSLITIKIIFGSNDDIYIEIHTFKK